jgi:hypothetical protein
MKNTKIRIESNEDLLKFVEREDVSLELAKRVTEKYLKVWSMSNTKGEFIKGLKEHIQKYSDVIERPIFF